MGENICKPFLNGELFAADIMCANISAAGILYKKTVYRFAVSYLREIRLGRFNLCRAVCDAAENEKRENMEIRNDLV